MARGFVQSLNLFESQDPLSALSILDNLAGTGISTDIRLFAENLDTVTEVDITEYLIENANDVEFVGNTSVIQSGGVIEDYYRFVIPPNRPDIVPFANQTVLFTEDADENRTYYIVKNSDTLTQFELFLYSPAGSVIGRQVHWGDFIDAYTTILQRSDAVLLNNMTNFSKDRPTLNDGANPEFSLVTLDEDITDDIPGELTFVDPSNNFLKATRYETYNDDIEGTIGQFYFKEGASILNYRHNSFTNKITIGGFIKIVNDAYDPTDPTTAYDPNDDVDATTFPGLYILANGQALRAFSDTTNPWNQTSTDPTIVEPNDGYNLSAIYVDPGVVGVVDVQVNKLKMIGPNPKFVFTNSGGPYPKIPPSNPPVQSQAEDDGGWTHKMEVEINGEKMYLLVADFIPGVG